MPSRTVGADFERFDTFGCIDDCHRMRLVFGGRRSERTLHGEPIIRSSFLVVQLKSCGDGAVDVVPCYINDAFAWVRELREGVREEIKVGGIAFRTLVDHLILVNRMIPARRLMRKSHQNSYCDTIRAFYRSTSSTIRRIGPVAGGSSIYTRRQGQS